MRNKLIDRRDQVFNLYDIFNLEEFFESLRYRMFTRESFDIVLSTALDLAVNESYPIMMEADRKGCRFNSGNISVPDVYHRLKKLFDDGGWSSLYLPREWGGQEFSTLMYLSACEVFMHNIAFFQYTNRPLSASDALVRFGTVEQKNRYLKKLAEGSWAGPFAITESDAGSDIGMISTKAVKQPDGSYRITGTKITITNGDSDLFANHIYIVCARIEGAPAGMAGLSLFIVPKFHVKDDGTPGERNDYAVSGLDKKMGLNGLSTCTTHFGENDNCYAEIIGQENMGLLMLASMLFRAQLNIGLFSTGIASTAYLHALNYARERRQGTRLSEAMNPSAPRVAIIKHQDVKRMLLKMKSHVEGMRSLVYYLGWLNDRIDILDDAETKLKTEGLRSLLTPVCTAFCSDTAFDVTREAMQVYGASGYFKDFPVEQFMRDVKVASLYEGSNGILALKMLLMNMGKNAINMKYLIEEIKLSIEKYRNSEWMKDTASDLE